VAGRTRIAITGVGAITPLGMGADALYRRWAAGEVGIEDGRGRCNDFDPSEFLTVKQARRMDRFTQLTVVAAQEAFESAGWGEEKPYAAERIGCVIGTGIGGLTTLENQHDVLRDRGPKSVSPLAVPLMMGNSAPASVSMRNDLRGPTFGVVSACAAGAQAIGAAISMIRGGEADAVVTGGSESAITPLSESAFAAMGATSEAGISRPFDARRDGFVMGEGAGVLVIEDYEKAEARGAEILAEIIGYGSSSDAYHLTAPDPDGRGAANAIKLALEDADVRPEDLAYINAHGTSTPLNDASETSAIKAALGEVAYDIPVSSLKSSIGHLLGAAGAVETIVTVSALREGVAPPTLGYGEPDEGLDLDYVTEGAKPMPSGRGKDGRRVAISNSFGFGGHNAVICIAAGTTSNGSDPTR
jgi:3-oxoacyl-[acyl-carrier-protein] synthase II